MRTDYVKCYTTKIEPPQSQGDIIGLLHRYGASGFGFRRQGPVIEVTFHVPSERAGFPDREVRIPINIDAVHAKLNPQLEAEKRRRKQALDTSRAQAERVAYRILLDWLDAMLAAVHIGAQTIEEAFFAHLVISTGEAGQSPPQSGRMVDYVHVLANTLSPNAWENGRLPSLGTGFEHRALGSGDAR